MPKRKQLTEQEALQILQTRIQEAIHLAERSGPSGFAKGREPLTYLFSEPGDYNQQRLPIVQVPTSEKPRTIGIERATQMPPELHNLLDQASNRGLGAVNTPQGPRNMFQKNIQMGINPDLLQMLFSMLGQGSSPIRGRVGPFNINAGPTVRPSQGKPDVGFGFRASKSF